MSGTQQHTHLRKCYTTDIPHHQFQYITSGNNKKQLDQDDLLEVICKTPLGIATDCY